MRLAVAPGSKGYYRIDREGRIYTQRSHMPDQIPAGEPPPRGEQQYVGATCVSYWLPTGQTEKLTGAVALGLFGADDEGDDLLEDVPVELFLVVGIRGAP